MVVMYRLLLLGFLIVNVGCAYTVFAPPKVLYSNEQSIGVVYRSAGIQSIDEPEKAIKLISDHCIEKYVIHSRTESDGWTTLDARCE